MTVVWRAQWIEVGPGSTGNAPSPVLQLRDLRFQPLARFRQGGVSEQVG